MRMRPKRPILRAMKNPQQPVQICGYISSGDGGGTWVCRPAGQPVQPGSIANVCPPGQVPMNGRCVAAHGHIDSGFFDLSNVHCSRSIGGRWFCY